ncbi:MAG: RNA-directed DNA polymerase [Planctomycetaceae bacterium]|nr:RNA-directed DNA polymerase [Planctomycetaceae bacterium]
MSLVPEFLLAELPPHSRLVATNCADPVIFERRFIFDSYACRRGKGTHRAIDRAHSFQRKYTYVLKTDIVRFFPNVDHHVMKGLLRRSIRDEPFLRLIDLIIDSGNGILANQATPAYFPGDNLFAILRPTGLPIGNLTSQFFANVLLDVIDHFVKEQLRIPGYLRYADDLLLFANSKRQLWDARELLEQELRKLRLRLHPDKTSLRPTFQPLTFLGLRLTPQDRRLSQSTLRRFNRRLRLQKSSYRSSAMTSEEIQRSLIAFRGHCQSANATAILGQILARTRFRRSSR